MLCDTVIEDARWQAAGLPDLAERAAQAVLDWLGLDADGFEISLLGCDDARIAVLNGDFRDRPQPTNVLSWPGAERGVAVAGDRPDLPDPHGPGAELGDIAIAWETCAAEARAAGLALPDHVTHLVVHAVLHLLGYDHQREADAVLMERTEVCILEMLGLPDPYDREHGDPDK